MTNDTLHAVILRLQSSAVECFLAIKDRASSPLGDGDVDFIAQQGMRLANLEGAILTLQQYAPNIEAYGEEVAIAKARAVLRAQEEKEPPTEAPVLAEAIDEDMLKERSPTFRKSQSVGKKKKKVNQDES